MTDHIQVNKSFVEALVENAAWSAAKVSLEEKKDSGAKKGDEGADKDKGDKPDFTTDARKDDDSKTKKGKKDYEDDGEKCESVEEHTCPLCESVLEEEISDEAILEHLDMVSELLEEFAANEDAEALDEEDDLEEESEEERREKHLGARGVRTPKGGKGLHSRPEQQKRGERQATTGGAPTRGTRSNEEISKRDQILNKIEEMKASLTR